jgi:DNA-directed RNA polymerase specialized sigma24 family protein
MPAFRTTVDVDRSTRRHAMLEHNQLLPGADGPDAVARVFVDYGPAVYRFLYRRVGNREDAEELTSEVFLRATQ